MPPNDTIERKNNPQAYDLAASMLKMKEPMDKLLKGVGKTTPTAIDAVKTLRAIAGSRSDTYEYNARAVRA